VRGDIERGRGTIARDAGLLPVVPDPEDVNYTRGFIDARRYTRISHGTAVNARIVAGGWLGGDRLPTQRRLSIGGPGSVEGYDFRRARYDANDRFTCGGLAVPGRPALCDRIALAQVELRQEFDVDVLRNDRDDDWWRLGWNTRGAWVIFADAGRGWNREGVDGQARGLPSLSTFRTSIGAGLDFGSLGVYLAKSTSTGREPMNVIVRLGRRF
jgi:outer membrane protein assembly factor BamA